MKDILIVEDEMLIALDLEDILAELGYSVSAIVSERSGVAKLRIAPSLAFVDINLRDGRTGPLIARELSEKFGTPIFYITANPDQIGVPAETAIGAIYKPFSAEAIAQAARIALEGQAAGPAVAGVRLYPTIAHH